jgi:hypothetical protein
MGVGLADFDLDGWMDIFVANDKVYNSYFHNKGHAKFEESSFDAGVALTEDGQFISGMGVDARDLDNDGLPDIVFVALENETFRCSGTSAKTPSPTSPQKQHGTSSPSRWPGYSAHHRRFGQRRLEGHLRHRGHVQSLGYASSVPVEQPNTVFRNLGAARFQALTAEAGLTAQTRQSPSRLRGRRSQR